MNHSQILSDNDLPARRIVIVSNRLPFSLIREEQDWKFKETVGGLSTGLSAYLTSLNHGRDKQKEYLWVGWPGCAIPDGNKEEVQIKALEQYRSLPVFLSDEQIENFYQGFCNKTIWPLFHYFPEYTRYNHEYWVEYEKVNKVFADALAKLIEPDDIVWIHDYHLMLLPKLLRAQFPDLSIGFFLHIPFPAFELFRLLPAVWRKEILEGLLGADVIGFHTYDYMQYFLRCVLRILGHEHNMGQLAIDNRIVKAGTFPMGIDFNKFFLAAENAEMKSEQDDLKKLFGGVKAVLSVDRLDYTKGIINRLQGFELMLEQHPEFRTKVMLVLIVAPSRIWLEHYEMMKRQIEELVGKINGKFGTLGWTPIIYQYKALSFQPLVALYSVSDVALITPLRDGMNLIAKEYIASRNDRTGALILSEMTGAAKELGEAIIINPNNREEIAQALAEAFQLPHDEQVRRNHAMQNRLRRYDIMKWATEFIEELTETRQSRSAFVKKLLGHGARERLFQQYDRADRRALFLDYDGTLVGFVRKPSDAKPTGEVLKLLTALAEDPNNELVLISGRKRKDLDEWFGFLNVGLAAEHGAWIKRKGDEWNQIKPMANDWKIKIIPILELYTDRLPGAFIEEKDFALAWHYRGADPEHGVQTAREMMDDLVAFTANIDVQVLQGNKVIEVRNIGVNKGAAAMQWLSTEKYDFILGIGDDWTDEDLFAALPEESYSIHVGFNRTHARYQLRSPKDVLQLLQQLTAKKNSAVLHENPVQQ